MGSSTNKRTWDAAFDDDDEWEHEPALEPMLDPTVMVGGEITPLMDFQLNRDVPRQTWNNVLDKDRFKATLVQNRDAVRSDDLGKEITAALRRVIQSLITANTTTLRPDHTLYFSMQSKRIEQAFHSTKFTVREFNEGSERLDTYLQTLSAKLNSSQAFAPGEPFTMEIVFVRTPGAGSGFKRYKPSSAAVRGITKKSRVTIKNRDELCCARAIVTMQALADADGNPRDSDYHNLKQGCPVQERRAKELHRLAGIPEGPCGIPEIQKFQEVLPGYQIKVMSIDPPHMIIFCGPQSDKIIRIIKEDDHYDGCNSFGGFLGKSYFCDDCNKGYNTEDFHHHPCEGRKCPACHRRDCPDFVEAKRLSQWHPTPKELCSLCHRTFFGDQCYNTHLQRQSKKVPSLCVTLKKCPECCKVYDVKNGGKNRGGNRRNHHKCGWGDCSVCGKSVDIASHQCYIQPEKDKPNEKRVSRNDVGTRPFREPHPDDPDTRVWVERDPPLQVYADFEAMTDAEGVQTPILLCAESDEDDKTVSFYGPDCTKRFFEWLEKLTVDQDGDDRKVIILFHNLKGYDGMFLLQHCYATHREVAKTPICNGAKVVSFTTDRLTFKDSLSFLPFPLANFPSTFGLSELCKGFFPHLFNSVENQAYEGPMPDMKYYNPDGMSPKKKAEFECWHAEKVANNHVFNLRREMQAYCESDVKLLKAGCQKFREEFKEHADFDPLEKCVTIASACHKFWRSKLLPPETIASEPARGWHGAQTNQSFKAKKWLAWQEHLLRQNTSSSQQGDRILHSSNGGEQRIANHLVDGYDPTTRTVYEFHGCLWHGCPLCHPHPGRDKYSKLHPDRTLQEVYEATLAKHHRLREHGYHLVIKWEHEWNHEVKTNKELQQFLSTYECVEPLNPRNAFFGGRTNAVKLHHEIKEDEGEQIKYVDVTSLYPCVNKTQQYPVGHPTVITNPENQDIRAYFGIAKIDILPPLRLYHPVLPYRHESKLVFPNCRACVEVEMRKPLNNKEWKCPHSDEERTIRGTWCTPEIAKAVEMGYTLVRIHEVWHFPKRQAGLFADYVNTWLKIKQESAGYPSWVTSPEQQRQYIHDYKAREEIDLDPAMIKKNPGRKTTAKLMLNSFWGKFGENLHKDITVPVTTPAQLFDIVSDTMTNIKQVRVCTPETLEVVYANLKDNQPDNGKTNIFIAAFTTCWARLKLYSYLQQLQHQVLYFDTDSVIYSWKTGQVDIPLGDFLGDMTNELDDGDYIVDFTSGGPKNYGYTTKKGKVCCKVRGFSLKSVRGSEQLNYKIMRQNVIDEVTAPMDERRNIEVVNPYFFTRDPTTKQLKVGPHTKRYGLVFDKRVVDPVTYKSYPYGYEPVKDMMKL